MRLKSIDIYGFKSQVDKKHYTLTENMELYDKNNVSIAIKWVMGVRSPKSLGVTKIRDIISGPLFAEVGLIIDNSDNKLPIESAEVKIVRRMYRQGKSEFFINGIGCWLKDIKGLCSGRN